MPLQLLPASAKAFATRSGPNIVLGTRAEPWLTQALKRVNKLKRPLNNISQHKRCLEDTLSGDAAIWSLASIMMPNKPKADLDDEKDDMVAAFTDYQLVQIEGYVVHIDMVSQHEVAFKLTQPTIDSLVEYHKAIFSIDTAAQFTFDWPDKDKQVKKMQDKFVQDINSYVFRTHVRALEGLDDEGTGELLEGRSQDVKTAINNLFHPLSPPPPKIVDVVAPPMVTNHYWSTAPYVMPWPANSQHHHMMNRPMEPWRVLGSTPSPVSTHSELHSTPWSSHSNYAEIHVASPTPSYAQPYTCSAQYNPTVAVAPTQSLPLPSQLVAQQCSTTAGVTYPPNYWGYNDFASPQYAVF